MNTTAQNFSIEASFQKRRFRIALLLFLFVASIYCLTSSGRVRVTDEFMVVWVDENIVTHGSATVPAWVPDDAWWGRVDMQGHRRAPYIPLHQWMVAPFYAVGRYGLSRIPGIPAEDYDLISFFTATLSNAFFAAGAVVLVYLFLSLRVRNTAALATALCIAFASPIFVYSAVLYPEPLNALLLMAAVYAYFAIPPPLSVKRCMAGTLLLALAMFIRPTQVLIAIPIAILIWVREKENRSHRLFLCVGIGLVAGLVYLLHNQMRYGNPLIFGYAEHMEAGRDPTAFDTPLLYGVWGYLLSPAKSIFLYCPLLIPSVYASIEGWKRDRELVFFATAIPLVFLLFFARYTDWGGGYGFGPRYMAPSILFALLPLALIYEHGSKIARYLAGSIAFVSFLVQCVGMAVSFLEAEVHHGYYNESTWILNPYFPSIPRHLELIWKYWHTQGHVALGFGFDRWWIFLAHAGVSHRTLWTIALPMLMVACISGLALYRSLYINQQRKKVHDATSP